MMLHDKLLSSSMTSKSLSVEDCKKVLQNLFNSKDVELINFDVKPISAQAEGFMGEHYNLSITYKLNDTTDTEIFFLKTKPNSGIQIEICNEYKAYSKEIFIYDTLITEFNKYGYNTNFLAKCYHYIPDDSLIFENLIHKGYTLTERHENFDLDKIKSALKALALYHAAGFAYQETKSKESNLFNFEKDFGKNLEESLHVFMIDPNRIIMKWWKSSMKTIIELIDLLSENEAYKLKFKNMFNNFPFGKVFIEKTKFAKTCGHGDLWSNNMLFKYENNEVIDCKLVDFQLCRYFYPCFDVLLVIFANTNKEFRKSHLNELFEFYYKTLGDTLNAYGCSIENIVPKSDFYETIRLTKADALLQILCVIMILHLPKEMLTSFVSDGEGDGLKDFMDDNTATCRNAFLNNTKYREVVSTALEDIRNALLDLQ